METYKKLYPKVYAMDTIMRAWRKARKKKTTKPDVVEFEKDIERNLLVLHTELKDQTYKPKPLYTFVVRDPKTRKISKADFRDRVVHHILIQVMGPILEKGFIHDSCAGRIGKGTTFAIQRFEQFARKVSHNCKNMPNKFHDTNYVSGYCLKADIKHYFQNIDHEILLDIIKRRIKDEEIIRLIQLIFNANFWIQREREYLRKVCL